MCTDIKPRLILLTATTTKFGLEMAILGNYSGNKPENDVVKGCI